MIWQSAAFTAIVTAFTKGFISPLLALLTGDSDLDSMTWVIRKKLDEVTGEWVPDVEILWGSFVQKVIDFLIIAFVLFLVMRIASAVMAHSARIRQNMIKAMTNEDEKAAEAAAIAKAEEEAAKAAEEAAKAEEAAALAKAEEEEKQRLLRQEALLTEIRDLLKNK